MTAKKYKVICMTSIRQFKSKTISNYKANTKSRQMLNFALKKVLLGYIQHLVTYSTLFPLALVKNFVKKIYGGCFGKNWTT